jgi:hypothetical protein
VACGECEEACDHEKIDQGECMEVLWLTNDDALVECQVGELAVEVQVDIHWNDDLRFSGFYEFTAQRVLDGEPREPGTCPNGANHKVGSHAAKRADGERWYDLDEFCSRCGASLKGTE